jgi:hypothetical protein
LVQRFLLRGCKFALKQVKWRQIVAAQMELQFVSYTMLFAGVFIKIADYISHWADLLHESL